MLLFSHNYSYLLTRAFQIVHVFFYIYVFFVIITYCLIVVLHDQTMKREKASNISIIIYIMVTVAVLGYHFSLQA